MWDKLTWKEIDLWEIYLWENRKKKTQSYLPGQV
jgi:hypothetical protein